MRNTFLLVVVLMGMMTHGVSAVEQIDEPLSFRYAMNWKSSAAVSFGKLDMQKIGAEDEANAKIGQPVRVAIVRKEDHANAFERQGEWSTIDDMSVWRLNVKADDAKWLSFAFENLFLPPGASLYIYNQSHEELFGPYTDRDNTAARKLWTPMVSGQSAYVEINVPTQMKPYLSFDLKGVSQGYRSLRDFNSPKALNSPKAGACNIDVVCPQGDAWRDEIRSVARFIFESGGGTFTCTGNLVNNTMGDRKAYFMTANHCVSTVNEVQSMVLVWNFEKSVCGGPEDGSQAQTQSGATLLATVGSLDGPEPRRDMTLVELNSPPNEAYNVHWSGWDASPVLPISGVSIHHPDGSEKRISIDSGPIQVSNFGTTQLNPNGTHLMIAAWDEGTTEGGSSGSGFWNQDKRIVGVLSGGGASCDTPDLPDFYAHLASHYDVGTTSATRMKAWLDPTNSGTMRVDGVDACDVPQVSFSVNPNPAQANQPVTFTSVVTGATGPATTYAWDFNADGVVDSTDASPTFVYTNAYVGNVELTVTNSQGCSASFSAAIVVFPEGGNSVPVAVASVSNASPNEGAVVQLNATGSSDADGDNLTYQWTQIAGPTATFADSTSAAVSVTLPLVTSNTVLTFEVAVTDSFSATDTDTVSVTVINVNQAPNASVSNSALSVNEGSSVSLNAGASSDPDGDSLSYLWTQTSGSAVTLNNPDMAMASFTAPEVGTNTSLRFSVTATDPSGLTDTASVTVTVNNVVPPDTGGSGAVGWPMLLVLCLVRYLRSARRLVKGVALIAGVTLISACGTSEAGSSNSEFETEVVSTHSVDSAPTVRLVKLGTEKRSASITNRKHVDAMVEALGQRERRYEKIKPIYEFELEVDVDGESEVWQVSPSGYIQKANSYELYKMDMSTLQEYMK